MNSQPNLSLEEFLEATRTSSVIPIYVRLFSGSESALGVYEKLAKGKPGTFLLESAEHGVWARYSFVGVSSRGFLSKASTHSELVWTSRDHHGPLANHQELSSSGVLQCIREITETWQTASNFAELDKDFPPLTSGLIGVLGWDLVRELEVLPNGPTPDFNAPVVGMCLSQDLVAIDHQRGELVVISNVFVENIGELSSLYANALERIRVMIEALNQPSAPYLASDGTPVMPDSSANHSEETFGKLVQRAKEFVRRGDVFQVVISQRFDTKAPKDPLDAYRALRAMNPSPYMYFLNFEDANGPYQIVGASPESLVQVRGSVAITHPIAGSRPRGSTPDLDEELATELVDDHKERAEHLMLVDLARNDLLKVCDSDSVQVTEFMQIHRYSHVMHLVSTVEGRLRSESSAVDAFAATFPAGTLSGAPKPRALEIIDELEESARGIYGGVVGYFDFAGNADLAIAIRTAFIRDGVAHIQAGAGIVLDSVASSEYQETISKASSAIRSVTRARHFEKVETDG